jgi:hypothetical protein
VTSWGLNATSQSSPTKGVSFVNVRELVEAELAKQGVSGYKLKWYYDPDWGYVYIVEVGLNARRALELWLKLVKLIPYKRYGIVIGVRWLGENNVSKDELVDYVVKIMVEGSLRTTALEHLDVVKELRGERGRR